MENKENLNLNTAGSEHTNFKKPAPKKNFHCKESLKLTSLESSINHLQDSYKQAFRKTTINLLLQNFDTNLY